VRGSLDKEVIRRVIRNHLADIRSCYERELSKDRYLVGRISVQFTVASTGDVIASSLQSSTMDNASVEDCVVRTVRQWKFPKPQGGGVVIISYPFNFTSKDSITIVASADGARAVDASYLNKQVVVHRSTDANRVTANGLILITKGGLLLVDTAWTDSQTEAILRWGEANLKGPWIGAVITHDHVDRAGGIGALMGRGIPVAALDLTVAKLAGRGVRNVSTLFTAQTGVFQDPRGFEAFYPGPGHAADNMVVRVGSVLFAGCFLKSNEAKDLGFTGAADLPAWPASIRRLRDKYGRMTIVPGHGPVDREGAAYQHTLDLLNAAAK
jgi:metallo-beta-lactamase class B